MKKILIALVALMFLATPAMAGNQPEFDAVGCDATNFFNDFIKVAVCQNGTLLISGNQTIRINEYSNFPTSVPGTYGEIFTTTAGMLLPDTCFGYLCAGEEYLSARIDPYNTALYRWQIVLQKKPESDININIRDCVTKHNTFDIWGQAEQTGRYRAPWGQLIFEPAANPLITVTATPGPFAELGFAAPFTMDARMIPSLALLALDDVPYTTKALWDEGIIAKLPRNLDTNTLGQTTYNLRQGDMITVVVRIPGTNTVDLMYGPDNVVLKYVGVVGMEYIGQFCGVCEGCELANAQ